MVRRPCDCRADSGAGREIKVSAHRCAPNWAVIARLMLSIELAFVRRARSVPAA